MIKYYIIYRISTGEILSYGTTFEEDLNNIPYDPSNDIVEVSDLVNNLTQYWDGLEVVNRPAFSESNNWNTLFIDSDGVSQATFGPNLPNPTTVNIVGPNNVLPVDGTIIDGQLEVTVNYQGTYTVTLNSFPYMEEIFTITGL